MDRITTPTIAIMGTGSWGTTLALLCACQGARVTLLARDAAEATRLRADGENRRFLAAHPFPANLRVTHDLAEGLQYCRVLLLVVPAQTMRANAKRVAPYLRGQPDAGPVLVSAAKGLELATQRRMTEVIQEEVPAAWAGRVAALSGPNIA